MILIVGNFFVQQAKLKQSNYTRSLLNAKRGLASLYSKLQNAMMFISSLQQKHAQVFYQASTLR